MYLQKEAEYREVKQRQTADELQNRHEYREQKLEFERERRDAERKGEILKAAVLFKQLDPTLTMPEAMAAARVEYDRV